MNKPRETRVYAWSVDELPEVIRVSDDILLVHCKDLVQVFARPDTKLNDVLKTLHEHFPRLGFVPLELMSNGRTSSPEAEGDAGD